MFSTLRGWGLADLRTIATLLATWRPDIVHMQFGSRGYRRRLLPWLMPWLIARRGIPTVQTWHEYSGDFLRIIRNLPNARAPGGLIVVKPNYLGMMHRWYRRLIAHKDFRYIPNAPAISHAERDRQRARGYTGCL